MLLNRNVLALAKLASKEASRYTLQAIAIERECAVVTDGHILVHLDTKVGSCKDKDFPETAGLEHRTFSEGPMEEVVLISRDAALAALKATPSRANIPVLQNAAMGKDGKLYVNTLDSVQTFSHRVDGKFPNWRAVVPTGEPKAEVCFSAKLMKQLCEYFIAVGERVPDVRLTIYSGTTAIRIDGRTNDSAHVTALLMPIRTSGDFAQRPDQIATRLAEEDASADVGEPVEAE